MNTWIIQPRDPLIVRDGRPFSADPGARARSLPFPMPSTIVGGVRTRAGLDASGSFSAKPEEVLKYSLWGPLLAELDDSNQVRFLAPAPADALAFETSEVRRLVPVALNHDGELSDLDSSLTPVGLTPVNNKSKPGKMVRFWHWRWFESWLLGQPIGSVAEIGHDGPMPELRTHVAIDPDSGTAREGALFQTGGLEFTHQPQKLSSAKRLAVALRTDATLRPGLAPLGGERRLMRWRSEQASFPGCPDAVIEEIKRTKACRLVLLTPGCFRQGYLPAHDRTSGEIVWEFLSSAAVKVKVRAVACNRPQVISGWNIAANGGKGQPKPSRRLVPAGSMYFLKLDGAESDIEQWARDLWMKNVSDKEQDRRDGFGLAALGIWSGKPVTLEVKS